MEHVKNKLKVIGFFTLILVNSGCSFLWKANVWESSKSPEWKDCDICYRYSDPKVSTRSYKFIADSCLLTICPCAKPGFHFLFGPPFIPVIPNPIIILPPKPNPKFFIDIIVDTRGKNITLNLSNFQFKLSKDTLTKPTSIRLLSSKYYGEPEVSVFRTDTNPNDSTLTNNLLVVTHLMIIRFEFSVLTTKVKHLSVRFDSIPEIKFKRHLKLVYKPFILAS